MAVRGRPDGRWRPLVARVRRILRVVAVVRGRLVVMRWVVRLVHRRPGRGWRRGLGQARFGVHALGGNDVSECRIVARLWQVQRAPGIVGDQVEMLARRVGDAERLLRQPVRLVPVPVRLPVIVVLVAAAARVRRLAGAPPAAAKGVPSLAFHLPVGEEAPGYPARAPGFAVGPSPHACFPFVPDEDGAGPDRLPLLFR